MSKPWAEHVLSALTELGKEAPQVDILSLALRIGSSLDRHLVLMPWKLSPLRVFGLWIRFANRDRTFDYILFERETARVHQEHIVLHELAHILLGHQTYTYRTGSSVPPELLGRSLDRVPTIEAEAEALASEMRDLIIKHTSLESFTQPRLTSPIWQDIARDLGYTQ